MTAITTEMYVANTLKESADLKYHVADALNEEIAAAAQCVIHAFQAGNKVLLFGNGGSAADAQHIAAEWIGRYKQDRRPLPAIALTTDSSNLTCITNDYSYDIVFARQVEALAQPGDVLIGISTSGKSPNVLAALAAGKQKGCKLIGFGGHTGSPLESSVDIAIMIPSYETARIQECHITIGHIICELVDNALFPKTA